MVCSIKSREIFRHYPFELICEKASPPRNCVINDLGLHGLMINIMFGMNGFGIENTPEVVGRAGYFERADIYYCKVRADCTCCYEISHDRMGESKVTTRSGCYCLKAVSSNCDFSWADIFEKKYETPEVALFTLAGFFLRKIGYAPTNVSWQERDSTGYIEYHPLFEDGICQLLQVRISKGADNGWHIGDLLDKDSRIQKKFCVICNSRNLSSPRNKKRVVFFFQLGCKRGHVICEDCVYPWLVKKEIRLQSNRPMEMPIANTDTSYLFNNSMKYCLLCQESLNPFVKVPLPGIYEMRYLRPIAWLGLKPIYSSALYRAVKPFYDHYVDWFVTAYVNEKRNFGDLKQRIDDLHLAVDAIDSSSVGSNSVCESLSSHEDELNLYSSFDVCNSSDLSVLRQRFTAMSSMMNYFDDKVKYVAFAVNKNIPFPEEFLNLDSDYYEFKLNKSWFKRLRNAVWSD